MLRVTLMVQDELAKEGLKYLQEQMVLRLWTPSIGQRTNLSTRDGNCDQKRLDSPLMPWREIQRKPLDQWRGNGTH